MHLDLDRALRTITASIVVALLLVACGTMQTRSGGIVERTGIAIIGDQIVGNTVVIDGLKEMRIQKSDLEVFQMGVFGAKNSVREDSQVVFISLDPGLHSVRVDDRGRLVLETKVLISMGQTKELILEN
jgi:hypothetical protein